MSSQHRSVFYFYPLLGILYFFQKIHNKQKQNKNPKEYFVTRFGQHLVHREEGVVQAEEAATHMIHPSSQR